jgi:hypothetical protein
MTLVNDEPQCSPTTTRSLSDLLEASTIAEAAWQTAQATDHTMGCMCEVCLSGLPEAERAAALSAMTPDASATPPHVHAATRELLDRLREANEAIKLVGDCIAANVPNLVGVGSQGEAEEIKILVGRNYTATTAQRHLIDTLGKVTANHIGQARHGIDPSTELDDAF